MRFLSFALLFALLGMGCGSPGDATQCAPVGSTVSCTCTDGRAGIQTCGSDHTLGACVCTSAGDASTDVTDSAQLDARDGAAMDSSDVVAADVRDAGSSDATDVVDAIDVVDAVDTVDVRTVGAGEVGAPCTRNSDCVSMLCLANGHCSRACGTSADCIPGWNCAPLPGVGNLCQCNVAPEQCDGLDNDCDGVIDGPAANGSCGSGKVCQGSACVCPAANTCSTALGGCADFANDPENCGACGNACPPGISCGAGHCNCPAGEGICGAACVNLQNDRMNCGACGNTCPSAEMCIGSQCVCPASGESLCNGVCVDTRTDARNCGACGTVCAAGGSCAGASCSCPGTMGTDCSGTCRDLATDSNNCGACGTVCPVGASCFNASCLCPGAMGTACNGTCYDLATDANHCGACTNACPSGASCSGGACVCPGATGRVCGGACHDVATDPSNCGSCGNACPSGGSCSNGVCQCPGGLMACGSTCSNVTIDPMHCGSCANACPAGIVCSAGACVPPAPRLLAPLSTATTTSLRPTFHVLLAPGTDGVRVDICRDRACTTVEQTVDGTGATATPTTSLSPGVHYWRAHGRIGNTAGTAMTGVWEFQVTNHLPTVNTSWGSFVDVNGDGYADALVGGPQTITNGPGLVQLYLGSSAGLATTPSLTINGFDGTPASFGYAIAGSGDVNGDGYGDVIITAYRAAFNTGHAYVFQGGPSGITSTPTTVLSGPDGGGGLFGTGVSSAGDIDGDGYSDVVIVASSAQHSYVYRGGPSGLASAPAVTIGTASRPGLAAIGVGDVNGDGYGDVLATGGTGGYLYVGSASGLSATPTALAISSGGAGYGVQDVNGDGYADLGFTSTQLVAPGSNVYTVAIYAGGTTVDTATPLMQQQFFTSNGGTAVAAGIWDLNGDGYDDLGISYSDGSTTTGLQIRLGSATGPGGASTTLMNGFQRVGTTMAGGGSVRNNGYGDLLANTIVNSSGAVELFYGQPAAPGVNTSPAATFTVSPADTSFGTGLAL